MIWYDHEGLTQHTELTYNIDDNAKRERNQDWVFRRSIDLHLPLFLTIPVWKRHGYTQQDIRTTLSYFHSIHLWQCALLFGISASNSSIKLAFATPESMVYGSKAIVTRKIERHLFATYDFPDAGSTLDIYRDDHVPPLPLHTLDSRTYAEMSAMVPENIDMLGVIEYPSSIRWRDIDIVPLWIEQDALYCIRIVALDVFKDSGRVRTPSLSNKPLDVLVDGVLFAGVEEAMFFVERT